MPTLGDETRRLRANPPRVRNPQERTVGRQAAHHIRAGRVQSSSIEGTYTATAYGPPWNAMNGTGVTAGGTKLADHPVKGRTDHYIIAVDPTVIPLGTKVYIWPNPHDYIGPFLADDTGGAIKGRRIDIYDGRGRFMQMSWGKRQVQVSLSPIRTRNFGNEDLGPGGPINFGGLDTGINSPLDLLKKLFEYDMVIRVLKVAAGGVLILFGLATVVLRTSGVIGANPVVAATRNASAKRKASKSERESDNESGT